jgi:hypothetical protein
MGGSLKKHFHILGQDGFHFSHMQVMPLPWGELVFYKPHEMH